MQQNLSLYKIFYTVAAAGNISKAAKELYISQPAISRAVKKLEENLNTVLFCRTSRGVILTQEGRTLFEHVQSAFSILEEGETLLLHNQQLGISHLRIGASSTLSKYVLLPYLRQYIEKFPHVRLNISNQSTYQTLSLLDDNKIDIGLIGRPESLKGYEFYSLKRISDIYVASGQYLKNLSSVGQVSSLYESATFMLLDEENITRQYVDAHMKEHHVELSHILEVTSMDLLIEFTKIGLGIGCVIKEFIQKELDQKLLTEVSVGAPLPPREIGFVCRKETKNLPVVQSFLKLLSLLPEQNGKVFSVTSRLTDES